VQAATYQKRSRKRMLMLLLFLVILLLLVILVTKPLRRSNEQMGTADPETEEGVQRLTRRIVRIQGISHGYLGIELV